jgi:hypothetical protein
MTIHGRTNLTYSPATDAGLSLWLDATDTATILNTVGGAIANGATIGTWSSKAGSARNFTQWGAVNRPTWDSNATGGKAGVKFVAASSQILTTQMNLADFHSMAGMTWMVAMRPSSGSGIGVATTQTDTIVTGQPTVVQIQANMGTTYAGGGRRLHGDSFVSVIGTATPAIAVETISFGFGSGFISLYQAGVETVLNQTFHTTGNSEATEPFALSVGGFARQNGATVDAANFGDGWLLEVLGWTSERTPDQLVEPHDYMCTRWGGGLM